MHTAITIPATANLKDAFPGNAGLRSGASLAVERRGS